MSGLLLSQSQYTTLKVSQRFRMAGLPLSSFQSTICRALLSKQQSPNGMSVRFLLYLWRIFSGYRNPSSLHSSSSRHVPSQKQQTSHGCLSLKELFSENAGSNGSVTADEIANQIMTMFPTWAQSQAENGLNAEALTTLFGIQADLIVNNNGIDRILDVEFLSNFVS